MRAASSICVSRLSKAPRCRAVASGNDTTTAEMTAAGQVKTIETPCAMSHWPTPVERPNSMRSRKPQTVGGKHHRNRKDRIEQALDATRGTHGLPRGEQAQRKGDQQGKAARFYGHPKRAIVDVTQKGRQRSRTPAHLATRQTMPLPFERYQANARRPWHHPRLTQSPHSGPHPHLVRQSHRYTRRHQTLFPP